MRSLKESLKVSKEDDTSIRFVSVDLNMEDYVNALEEVTVRPAKKKELLNNDEMKLFRKLTGKISWLASNCRPDLSFNALKMSMKSKEAKIEDLKYANSVVRKAKQKVSRISYRKFLHFYEGYIHVR